MLIWFFSLTCCLVGVERSNHQYFNQIQTVFLLFYFLNVWDFYPTKLLAAPPKKHHQGYCLFRDPPWEASNIINDRRFVLFLFYSFIFYFVLVLFIYLFLKTHATGFFKKKKMYSELSSI